MKRHPTDVISLVAGLLFATLGVMFGFDELGSVHVDVTWIPAIVLLGLGLGGIASGIHHATDASFGGHIDPRNDASG